MTKKGKIWYYESMEDEKKNNRSPLDKEKIRIAASFRRLGMPKKHVAAMIGVTRATYYNWHKRGEELAEMLEAGETNQITIDAVHFDKLCFDFFYTQEKAAAELVKEGLEAIILEGPEGYRWILPRIFPEEFNLQNRIAVDAPYQLTLGLLDEEKE